MKAILPNWIILEWTIDEIRTVLEEVKEIKSVKKVKRKLWDDDWMYEMKHDYPYTEQELWERNNVSSSESWPGNPATY